MNQPMPPQDMEYIEYQPPMAQSGIPKSDRADLIDKIDPKNLVEMIRHKLLGEEWDGNEWKKIPALRESALTERGAWEISNLMLGVSSINITVSRFDSHIIKARFKRTIRAAMLMIAAHWREYGISNTAQFYFVDDIIRSNTLAVLNQAGDGSIQELLKGTVTENRQVFSDKKEPSKWKKLIGLG